MAFLFHGLNSAVYHLKCCQYFSDLQQT